MNVVFITLSPTQKITRRGIYTDLIRKFRDDGHNVYVISPLERRLNISTSLKEKEGVHFLGVRTLNIFGVNIIEKGVGTILLERQFKRAIKNHLGTISFDLILYSTPPITFNKVVKFLKKKNPQAICYLLLKDIFPQNAVDLQMFSKNSLFYLFFRQKEIGLYKQSDFIGCMSPANVKFLLKNNSFISTDIVEIAPNSISLVKSEKSINKFTIRQKYELPIDKPIFIYGGNLGKPQGIEFLIQCLDANKTRNDCYFLVVGDGTSYIDIERWYNKIQPENMSLFKSLPKEDYDQLVQSCDIGLIFLDHRFTIPNYPSRLLSYLEYKMPIVAATDPNTDIGTIAEENGYGFWCESNDVSKFNDCINRFINSPDLILQMGEKGYQFLKDNYLVDNTYHKIMQHLK